MSPSPNAVSALGLGVLAVCACSGESAEWAGPGFEEPLAGSTTEGRYGLIVLRHDFGEGGVAVSGQFIHYKGQERAEALHALALPEVAWLVDERPLADHCRDVESSPANNAGYDSYIDLLDAGDLSIDPPGPESARLTLSPKDFPRVAFTVSGVVYDVDAPQVLAYQAQGTYTVSAPGDEVGPLYAQVSAPSSVQILDHQSDEDGLWVQWAGGEPSVITVARPMGSTTQGIQCSVSGGDELRIPGAALRRLGDGPAQLSVVRVATQPLPEGDLLFVVRDATNVQLGRN